MPEEAAPADSKQPGVAVVRQAQGAAVPNCSWVPHWVPRSCSLLRATSAVTGSCKGVESEDALLCRSPWVVRLSKTHQRRARGLGACEHDTRKRLKCGEAEPQL